MLCEFLSLRASSMSWGWCTLLSVLGVAHARSAFRFDSSAVWVIEFAKMCVRWARHRSPLAHADRTPSGPYLRGATVQGALARVDSEFVRFVSGSIAGFVDRRPAVEFRVRARSQGPEDVGRRGTHTHKLRVAIQRAARQRADMALRGLRDGAGQWRDLDIPLAFGGATRLYISRDRMRQQVTKDIMGKRLRQTVAAKLPNDDVFYRRGDGILNRNRRPLAKICAGADGRHEVVWSNAELIASGLNKKTVW